MNRWIPPGLRTCRTQLTAVCIWLFLMVPPVWAETSDELVIVSHPSVKLASLSRESLWAMFGMHHQRWPDGQRVKVFVLENKHALHRRFATDLLGTYPYQLERVWQRLVYSGTGRAPHVCKTEEEMKRKVSTTPGAIGYLRRSAMEGGLHVIDIN